MTDPIEPVIQRVKQCEAVQRAWSSNALRSSFLNAVAEVFENHGFETARLYVLRKREQTGMRDQAEALLEVLQTMKPCEAIRQRRAIGATVIKTLDVLRPVGQRGPGGRNPGGTRP